MSVDEFADTLAGCKIGEHGIPVTLRQLPPRGRRGYPAAPPLVGSCQPDQRSRTLVILDRSGARVISIQEKTVSMRGRSETPLLLVLSGEFQQSSCERGRVSAPRNFAETRRTVRA